MAANEAPPGLDEFVNKLSGAAQESNSASLDRTPADVPAQDTAPAGLNEFIAPELNEEKYGGTGQQLLTGVEGAADAATFGLSEDLENKLSEAGIPGLSKQDRIMRQETNPGDRMIGQGVLLVGSALTGVGAAPLMERAGAAVAKKLLPKAESVAAKIGSAAVKGAVENAIYQVGDEHVKYALGDPNSVQTAAADIALSGLIGGVFMGGASAIGQGGKALWNTTYGKQTQGVLKAIQNKLGGVEGQFPDAINDALNTSQVEVPAAVKAVLMEDPWVRRAGQTLNDAATDSGMNYKQNLIQAHTDLSNSIATTLGYVPESVDKLQDLSLRDIGDRAKESIVNKIKTEYAPLKSSYDKISEKFKNTIIPEDIRASMADQLAKVLDNGASQESAAAKFLNRVIGETSNPKLATLEQLRNYTSDIREETSGIAKQELWKISSKIRNVLNSAEENTLNQVVSKEAPELIAEHAATNSAYKELKNTIGDLNDRIKVGPHKGPKTFLSALADMDSETLMNRLNPSGKSSIIEELSNKFPEVAEQVRQYHLDKLMKTAASVAPEGQLISAPRLIKEIDKLSPEMRKFLLPEGAAEKIKAVDTILSNLPEKIGKSGTPEGQDALNKYVIPSALATVAMLSGHGVYAAALAGYVAKSLGRDVPDAIRYGLLKFLGSNKEVSAPGFKAMVDYIHSAVKSENMLGKSTKALFKAGREVIPTTMVPGASDRDRLEKQLKDLRSKPELYGNLNSSLGHYLPDHAQAAGATVATAINYLNSIRPTSAKLSPLDQDLPINPSAKSAYNRALDIAQQPLVVLNSIKQGTITSKDVTAIKTMYPALYARMSEKIMNEVVEVAHKGESIPYKTRIGLSMFLGQPLDSSMRPESIMSSQPNAAQRQNQQVTSEQGSSNAPAESKMRGISKLPGQSMTADQSRSVRRQRQD